MAKKIKIATVVGARPQFIKLAPLSRQLRKKYKEVLIHTGQHYDKNLSDIFFKELKLPHPDYNLNVGSGKQGEQTGIMMDRIERILLKERPGLVLVYGDTNSTLAGALAAAKLNIPIAHIEAGLRSYNRRMPEEVNRVLTDHLSALLFCPTEIAVENLKKEGIVNNVFITGDIMCDALKSFFPAAKKRSKILNELGIARKNFYLLTIHRQENTEDLDRIIKLISHIDQLDIPTVFPIHPRTSNFLEGLFKPKKNLRILSPVSYADMLILEEAARFIFTDSGGVQKEAYMLRTPCITLRKETEWVETVIKGCNFIMDPGRRGFFPLFDSLIKKNPAFTGNLYGKGDAAERIARIVSQNIY